MYTYTSKIPCMNLAYNFAYSPIVCYIDFDISQFLYRLKQWYLAYTYLWTRAFIHSHPRMDLTYSMFHVLDISQSLYKLPSLYSLRSHTSRPESFIIAVRVKLLLGALFCLLTIIDYIFVSYGIICHLSFLPD